jgi:hypothetical protein
VWERIYLFFFGGRKENRLQRFMEQNLENTLQTALSEYVKFRIEVTNPMVIWLPFAGHKRPPHITSQVTRLQFGVVSVSNCDHKIERVRKILSVVSSFNPGQSFHQPLLTSPNTELNVPLPHKNSKL